MSILTLGQIAANQNSVYKLNQKAGSAASDVSKAAEAQEAASDNTDQVSANVAAQRAQQKISSFRQAAQETARSIAQVAFALRSTSAIGAELADLEALAKKALKEPLDEKSLERLNKSIKSARANIDNIAAKNQLPKTDTAESDEILPELSSDVLLGDELSLTSQEEIEKFLSTVRHSATQVASLNLDVQQIMQSYESMATNFEVSMQNQLASTSVLPDQAGSVLDALFGNAGKSLSAQGNHLTSNLLALL